MLNNAILLFTNIFRLYFQNIYTFIGVKIFLEWVIQVTATGLEPTIT